MQHIQGQDRNQISMVSLDELISTENAVRLIDAFVEKLDLGAMHFVTKSIKQEGRPSFEGKVFLKLYLYSYMNGIRSSRKMEKECERNVELQWLLKKIVPNYHSISDFRKNNSKALVNLFKLYVMFLKESDLVSGRTVAIDGTKTRAHNSKKNNFSPKKIARHLQYIEEKSREYLSALAANDVEETGIPVKDIEQKLNRLKEAKIKYELLGEQLEKSGETQVSTTDADARALLVQGQVVEVSYNIQAAVDEKHKLVVATHAINKNDRNALHRTAMEAKENLEAESITAISDKGFHNGRQLQQCKDNNITTICAQQEIVNTNDHGTTEEYLVTKFTYNESNHTYTCPEGHTLKTQGTWHKKTRERDSYLYKKYRTPECKTCPVKHLCTGKAKGGREIERSEFAKAVEENAERYRNNKELYRKRQEWNEHIFGTIKRKWGYYYTNLKGIEKVTGEYSLIMMVYNFRRSINILGIGEMLEKIKNWVPNYKGMTHFNEKTTEITCISRIIFYHQRIAA
jgi:transposase/uncharacterized protein (UPF0179 family)